MIAQGCLMRWIPCMLREFNLVGCSYIGIIDARLHDKKGKQLSIVQSDRSFFFLPFSILLTTEQISLLFFFSFLLFFYEDKQPSQVGDIRLRADQVSKLTRTRISNKLGANLH
jgi:hypothetical protein